MKHHDSHPLYERNEKIEFFKYLVNISLADGIIDNAEQNILHYAGKKLGLTNPEVDKMIAKPSETTYHPPYELEKRFHQLFEIVKLIISDNEIHDDEMKFAMFFAISSGFDPEKANKIIHFIARGIEDGLDEDDVFAKYKKGI